MGPPKNLCSQINYMINKEDKLQIGGVDAAEITKEHGTPLYVYDKETIQKQYQKLDEAFSTRYSDFSISYAVKANNNPAIVKTLVEQGAGLDCASKAEIMLASELVESEKIIYTAPFPSKEELEYALEKEVTLNLNSVKTLEKLEEIETVPERLSFRIDPGMGKGDFGLVLGDGSKFGVPEERAIEAYSKAKELGVERFGIHMMTGSNVNDPEYFGQITEKLLQIAAEISEETGIEFEFVDIGGGIGIPYRPEEDELELDKAAENTVDAFEKGINNYDIGKPTLKVEPGRFLVAGSGVLLTRVMEIKQKQKTFVGTDTGMHQMIRPMLYDAYHEVVVANDLERPLEYKKDVVGCVCENDYLAKDRKLPKIKEKDLLGIMNAGAYGFTMASNWNSRPLPPEVLVENGEMRLIREGQDDRDVFHGTELEDKL